MLRAYHLNCARTLTIGWLFFAVGVFAAETPALENEKLGSETVETTEVGSETSRRWDTLHPSVSGGAGIFRTRSAEGLPPGSFTFGIGGEFYSVNNVPLTGGGVKAQTIAESLFVGFSPAKDLTLSIMRRGSSTTYGNPSNLVSSLGDFNFSGQYSIPVNDSLTIAPILNVLIASDFNNLSPSGQTMSVGGGLAATYGFDWMAGLPLYLHANLLYHMPQIRGVGPGGITTQNFFKFSRFHTVELNVAAEFKLGDFIPFVEFNQTAQLSSGISWASAPSRLSLGLRVTPLTNKSLAILLGGDIGLGKGLVSGIPYTPGGQVIGMVSYTVALSQTERKHYYTNEDVNIVDRKFDINRNIEFELNSDKLTADGENLVDSIADVIKKNKVNNLMIVGHTDATHTADYNLKLSKRRAESVKARLVKNGIDKDGILTDGIGKMKPIASNDSDAGRAKNRRVEFFILN